jgi:mannosyl-3-phosphoglycerate phosphatase family protein
VLFTDLDGTLLDLHTYRPSPAAVVALRTLAANRVAVLPVSSKTAAEIGPLLGELGLAGPAIAEGGAVLIGEGGREQVLGTLRPRLIEILREVTGRGLPLRGLSEMSVAEVAERTGLGPGAAARAMARLASEPFVTLRALEAEELERLESDLVRLGAGLVRGGRFWHLAGAGVDKALGVRIVLERWGEPRPATAAVGDAWNDLPMLAEVDLGYLLGDAVDEGALPVGVTRLAAVGPAGFVEAVRRLGRCWRLQGLGMAAGAPGLPDSEAGHVG